MVKPGVYSAAVTPFDEKGKIDMASVAKLLAYFEAAGCTGVVFAGTNGEGPSLSAPEKRDLLCEAMNLRGKLDLILGLATCSITEAIWLCKQAYSAGAAGVLVMPPYYFKEPLPSIQGWFMELLDKSPTPVIVYNFPQRSGTTFTAEFVKSVAAHSNCAGIKDSSGSHENLEPFRSAVKRDDQVLFVGDETLLYDALELGWSGTISGVTNSLPDWTTEIVRRYFAGDKQNALAKFELLKPVVAAMRSMPQPAVHKSILYRAGVIERPDLRTPLTLPDSALVDSAIALIRERLG